MRHFGISIVVAYALSLAACGQAPSGGSGETPPTRPGPEASAPSGPTGPGADDSPVDQPAAPAQAQGGNPAYYLATLDELPSCDDEHRRWLAYVAEAGAFYHCALDGWQVVELKGKDGASGQAGAAGRDGTSVDNTWRDPATGRVWLLGSSVLQREAYDAELGCADGYRMPTYDEASEAYRNGLGSAAAVLFGGGSGTAFGFWIVPTRADRDRQAFNVLESAYTGVNYRAPLVCYKLEP